MEIELTLIICFEKNPEQDLIDILTEIDELEKQDPDWISLAEKKYSIKQPDSKIRRG